MTTEINLVKYNFYSTVVADILKAVDGGSFGGAFILSFCSIDYLGWHLSIENKKVKNDKYDYMRFIDEYMLQVNSRYNNLNEKLYAIRCSLVHNYGESDATVKQKVNPFYLFGDGLDNHLIFEKTNHRLFISLSDFIGELISSIEIFFLTKSTSSNSFSDWAAKLYYPKSLKANDDWNKIKNGTPINYKTIHPVLEILDTEKEIILINTFIKNKVEERIDHNLYGKAI